MNCVPFTSPEWSNTSTLAGVSSDLVPPLRTLEGAADWSASELASDWLTLHQAIVDGSDLSNAVLLVLPWVVEFARGRSAKELVPAWLLIGEVELARLSGGKTLAFEEELRCAAEVACPLAGTGTAPAQRELGAAICLLPRLPEWARAVILRLTVIGQKYVACPVCGEILDAEWNGEWRVGGQSVQLVSPIDEEMEVMRLVQQEGQAHQARSLAAVGELIGFATCADCGGKHRVLELLASPLPVPDG